ncbi:MAG TPA: ABC transporter ATP-binding protein [Acidimicrobiia bacterium]|jgi:NitT/TauT family transport system ATP-binding protein
MRVDIDHVRFAYPGSRPALDDVKLTVESSSIHAVVGPNGCGKSTLLRLIAGMESPTAGEVRITGERRHTNETAIVFQDPRLLGWWNVGRNIGIGPEFGDVEPSMYERLRDFFASHVGLGHLVDRLPGTLSRGQQSRAGLGRALAHDADVVLLDEPFTHLDRISRTRLHTEIEAFWLADRRTIILVTHDIEEAVTLSDRVSVMSASPGTVTTTIEVDAARPRSRVPPTDPGLRAAIAATWEALEHPA